MTPAARCIDGTMVLLYETLKDKPTATLVIIDEISEVPFRRKEKSSGYKVVTA